MSYKNIPRIYINKELKSNIELSLEKKDIHYLKHVLRLSVSNKIKLFNGVDGEWEAVILSNDCKKAKCTKILKKQSSPYGPNLYFSLIKSSSLKWLIEKSTELGVKELYPIITERVNIKGFNYKKALLYLREASKVSERLNLPILHEVRTLDQTLYKINQISHNIIFCNESKKDIHLSNYFKKNFSREVSFIIGPEGGFSDKEIKKILGYSNIKSVKLHNRVIKAETASVLALSIYNSFLFLDN